MAQIAREHLEARAPAELAPLAAYRLLEIADDPQTPSAEQLFRALNRFDPDRLDEWHPRPIRTAAGETIPRQTFPGPALKALQGVVRVLRADLQNKLYHSEGRDETVPAQTVGLTPKEEAVLHHLGRYLVQCAASAPNPNRVLHHKLEGNRLTLRRHGNLLKYLATHLDGWAAVRTRLGYEEPRHAQRLAAAARETNRACVQRALSAEARIAPALLNEESLQKVDPYGKLAAGAGPGGGDPDDEAGGPGTDFDDQRGAGPDETALGQAAAPEPDPETEDFYGEDFTLQPLDHQAQIEEVHRTRLKTGSAQDWLWTRPEPPVAWVARLVCNLETLNQQAAGPPRPENAAPAGEMPLANNTPLTLVPIQKTLRHAPHWWNVQSRILAVAAERFPDRIPPLSAQDETTLYAATFYVSLELAAERFGLDEAARGQLARAFQSRVLEALSQPPERWPTRKDLVLDGLLQSHPPTQGWHAEKRLAFINAVQEGGAGAFEVSAAYEAERAEFIGLINDAVKGIQAGSHPADPFAEVLADELFRANRKIIKRELTAKLRSLDPQLLEPAEAAAVNEACRLVNGSVAVIKDPPHQVPDGYRRALARHLAQALQAIARQPDPTFPLTANPPLPPAKCYDDALCLLKKWSHAPTPGATNFLRAYEACQRAYRGFRDETPFKHLSIAARMRTKSARGILESLRNVQALLQEADANQTTLYQMALRREAELRQPTGALDPDRLEQNHRFWWGLRALAEHIRRFRGIDLPCAGYLAKAERAALRKKKDPASYLTRETPTQKYALLQMGVTPLHLWVKDPANRQRLQASLNAQADLYAKALEIPKTRALYLEGQTGEALKHYQHELDRAYAEHLAEALRDPQRLLACLGAHRRAALKNPDHAETLALNDPLETFGAPAPNPRQPGAAPAPDRTPALA